MTMTPNLADLPVNVARRLAYDFFRFVSGPHHGLAGALGAWITATVSPDVLRWVLGLSFIGMAIWTMIPDKIAEEETQIAKRFGVFGATLITFFLAEMGDKTQIATVAMAAHYASPLMVVIGTTLACSSLMCQPYSSVTSSHPRSR